MVDSFIEMVKKDIGTAIQTPNITFEQVHYILRMNIEKLLMYDKKKYGEQIQKYFDKETEITSKIQKITGEIIDLKKELAGNDESMYEAIKKL